MFLLYYFLRNIYQNCIVINSIDEETKKFLVTYLFFCVLQKIGAHLKQETLLE
jgi:hypothetical protein